MINEEKRIITILIILFIFTLYSLNNPFFFNKMVHTRLGRLSFVLFLLFTSYYNIYIGFMCSIIIILLSINLNNSNIVNIKSPKYENVKPDQFYKFMGFERVKESFVTRSASKTQGKARGSLTTQQVLDRLDDDNDIEFQSNDEIFNVVPAPDLKTLKNLSIENKYITDLLDIQNIIRPKDSSTLISSPIFLVK